MSATLNPVQPARGAVTTADLHVLVPQDEKPRNYAYDPPDGTPRSNARHAPQGVPVHDARRHAAEFALDRKGFALVRHHSAVRDVWDEDEVRRVYYPKAERLIREATGADRVFVFDHTLRRRVPGTDDSTAGLQRQPVTRVHADQTLKSGPQRVRDLLPDDHPGRMTTRRDLLAGLATAPLLGRAAWAASGAADVLRAGDQKGGTQSVMKAAGVLDGLPYRLEWSQFSAAAPLLEVLNAGAVDLAFAGDAPATFAMAAGLQARIISPVRTSGAGTAIMVPPGSSIRTVADLRGRSIAANRGSIAHALILAVAEAQGWSGPDTKFVNLLPNEAKTALSAGAVDAWCSWGVYVAQARLVDGARIVVDGGNGLLTGLSYLVASDDAIARRRAALLDFCRRLAVARRWADAHRDEYARVLAAEIGVSQPVARLVFETETPMPVPVDAKVVADEQRTADRYLAAGVIRRRLDAARLFDPSFNVALPGSEALPG